MVTYLWENLATATGLVKEDILGFKDVQPCWFLTKIVNDALALPQPTVMYPSQPHLQMMKIKIQDKIEDDLMITEIEEVRH